MASKYTSPIETDKSYMAYLPAVLVAAGIAVVSLMENPRVPESVRMSDKLAHALMYVVPAALWAAAMLRNRYPLYRAVLRSMAVTTAYGALMEYLQYACTETRSGEWLDVAADFAGAAAGCVIVCSIQWYRRTHTISR